MTIASITYVLLFIIIISYFLWTYFKQKKLLTFCRLQGGPRPYPILGNIPILFNQNMYEGLCQLKKAFSLPCNFWVWSDYYYVTECPHETKTLLSNTNKSFQKAPFYDDLIKVILNNTLVTASVSNVENWKYERKIISKAFASCMWSRYTPVFHRQATKLIKSVEKINDFTSLVSLLQRSTFEIFMENFMGMQIKNTLDENKLLTALTELLELLSQRSTINRLLPHWFYKHFTAEGIEFYRILNVIEGQFKKLIDNKRVDWLKKNEFIENPNKLILIEALLFKEKSLLDTNAIYRQMILIYITSIDTSVFSLAFTLLQLGMNSDIQEKVYQEVKQSVGSEREIVTEDLGNFKYLEQCIFETLRLYPIVPFVGKHITENIQIGKKILPKGANAIISPYLVQRNEKYWSDPEVFDPSRFSVENTQNIVPGSFIPFLLGPRDCLGRYYSMAQVKVMAANIIRTFSIHINPQTEKQLKFKFFLTIRPNMNFNVEFIRRNNNDP